MIQKVQWLLRLYLSSYLCLCWSHYFVVPIIYLRRAYSITWLPTIFWNPVSLMNLLINIPLIIWLGRYQSCRPSTPAFWFYFSLFGSQSWAHPRSWFKGPHHRCFSLEVGLELLTIGIILLVVWCSDIVARILNKYTNLSIGNVLNNWLFILMLILLIFKISVLHLYSLVWLHHRSLNYWRRAPKGFHHYSISWPTDKIKWELDVVTFISGQGCTVEDLKTRLSSNEIVKWRIWFIKSIRFIKHHTEAQVNSGWRLYED